MKKIIIGFFVLATTSLYIISCSPKSSSSENKNNAESRNIDSKVIQAGQQVYNNSCGRCHELKEPSDYSASRWHSIMNSMAPKARLNNEEKSNALAYVLSKAR